VAERAARLGVAAALVDGEVLAGDVSVDPATGRIDAVGLPSVPSGGLAVPGLVDLQVNGFDGVEFRWADVDGYAAAARSLAAHGATAVQPTFFSCSLDDYERALGTLALVHHDPPAGCRFLGAHLEGPFLSPAWCGAHLVEFFVDPDPAVVDRLLGAGPVSFVTLAPERDGALATVAHLVAAGVTVSIGHSDADAAAVRRAVEAGARHVTHCWNAHRRFAPRDPGPAGVALTDERLTVGLIPDLVHVAPEVVALTLAAATGRVAATTDAIPPAGSGLRSWSEHGRAVGVDDRGAARLDDGTLAGSVATPDLVLRNLVATGATLAAAVDACGGAQRRLLGLPAVRLRPGDPADVVVLDDDLHPVRTVVGGHTVWGDDVA
jgi:N-acetylglucosamine-6-phosphate deacetylase